MSLNDAGSQRVTMRQGGVLTYLHGDHLGSASLATDVSGAKVSEQRYLPYGGTRSGSMPTDRQYTGQRRETSLGFYDFVARQFDPALGRFLQADSIIPDPGNPQSLNRYSYTLGNPLRYTDPSGHIPEVIYNELGYYVVRLDIQMYGSGSSVALAEEWQKYLNTIWNTDAPQYKNSPVIFEITVLCQEPGFTAWGKFLNWVGLEGIARPKSGETPNLVFVAPGGIQNYRPFVDPHTSSDKSFDWGSWFSEMGNGYVFHESAHLFGIYQDRYDQQTETPLPGYERYITADGKGSFVQKPAAEEVREIINLATDRGQFRTQTLPSPLR